MKATVLLCTVIVFLVDLVMPLGVAVAVPYVGVILLTLWLPDPRTCMRMAVLTTVLSIIGFFFPQTESTFFILALEKGDCLVHDLGHGHCGHTVSP